MAKYKYVGGLNADEFVQGLPAGEVNSDDLDEGQLALLASAVERGVYRELIDVKPGADDPKKKTGTGSKKDGN